MRRINRCLNTKLLDICKRTVQLEELSEKLLNYLPLSLQPHCHVGSFTAGCLVIVVNDPIWGTQLRYSIPELRDKLRGEAGIYQLTSIKVTIASSDEPLSSPKKMTPLLLSPRARETLIEAGEQCTYEPLKAALLMLGKKHLK